MLSYLLLFVICKSVVPNIISQAPAGSRPEPLLGKLLFYLSPAPQAEPHAEGFSSGLSPAPQAEPHAEGFSSGLSPAPQAEPPACASFPLFHPKRFESAIFFSSFLVISKNPSLCDFIVISLTQEKKYAQIYYLVTFL